MGYRDTDDMKEKAREARKVLSETRLVDAESGSPAISMTVAFPSGDAYRLGTLPIHDPAKASQAVEYITAAMRAYESSAASLYTSLPDKIRKTVKSQVGIYGDTPEEVMRHALVEWAVARMNELCGISSGR